MLFAGFEEEFNRLPLAILAKTFERILLTVRYQRKVTMILLLCRDRLLVKGDRAL